MNAPIVLFVYNRPNHTRQTLLNLSRCDTAKESDLFIYSDAPRDETSEESVNQVREIIRHYKDIECFKNVHIVLQDSNCGLERSIISGVTKVMREYGCAIVLEDDIVVSRDFLKFMNGALEAFRDDSKVWSVSGYSLNNKAIASNNADVLWTYRGECWGWASWIDRWEKVDWSVSDYKEFLNDRTRQKQFNRAGADMTELLVKQMNGEINSWAIRWCYQQFKEDTITIFPRNAKAYNAGMDGSGTNCAEEEKQAIDFVLEDKWNYRYNLKDTTLVRAFQKHYSKGHIRRYLGAIWYNLTEYEYLVCYKHNGQEYRVLKPNIRYWYADPIIYRVDGKVCLFVEAYNKFTNRGGIAVSILNKDGKFTYPKLIISEPFHMSFPNVFEMEGYVYMLPECSESEQLRIYKMGSSVYEWALCYSQNMHCKLVDSIVVKMDNDYGLLSCELNEENPHQTRLIYYSFDHNLPDEPFEQLWQQEDFSYQVRNGGPLIEKNGQVIRVVQNSTPSQYGKSISLKIVDTISEYGIQEMIRNTITLSDINLKLTPFIYRKWGVHTYSVTGDMEVIDMHVQRFSLGGLLHKVLRRL